MEDDSEETDTEQSKKRKKPERKSSIGDEAQISNNVNGNPIPICHLPFESLTNIPTTRFADKEDDTSKVQEDMPQSPVFVCSGSKFLNMCRSYDKNFLDRVNLIVIDNVHDALKDSVVRRELREILHIIR